jgi:hypothetical protein
MKKQVCAQGIGRRHTMKEVEMMAIEDLRAASFYFGDKEFIMGDGPSNVDCTAFGFIAGILHSGKDDGKTIPTAPNLMRYSHRRKGKF